MTVPEAGAPPMSTSLFETLCSEPELKFSKTFPLPHAGKEEARERIASKKALASEVSAFLRTWLQPADCKADVHTSEARLSLRKKGITFCGPEHLRMAGVTKDRSDDFQARVSDRIGEFLRKELGRGCPLVFIPEGELSALLMQSHISVSLRDTPIFPKHFSLQVCPIDHPTELGTHEVRVAIDLTPKTFW